jgi:hypothetical protein
MSAFKDIYDILKDLLKVAKDAGNQILVDKAMEIQAKLFEFKEENETLKDEIKRLQEQIKGYDQTAEVEATLITHSGGYYTVKDDTVCRFFCNACWQSGKNLFQLNAEPRLPGMIVKQTKYKCPHCKTLIVIPFEEIK